MPISLLFALLTIICFQWSVNGSVQLLHSRLTSTGHNYSATVETLVLFGAGQLFSSFIFNSLLKKLGFLRVFMISTLFIVTLFLVLDIYFSLSLVQLLMPFISIGQSIGYLCLLDLFAPMFSSYFPGLFSIVIHLGKSVGIILPFLMFDKLNILLCVMMLISLLIFATENINIFTKHTEMFADVADIYKNYRSFFLSCVCMKIGDTMLCGFFRITLKLINFSPLQSQYLSIALLLGNICGVLLYINDNMVTHVSILINILIMGVFGAISNITFDSYQRFLLFMFGIFLYGSFSILNRHFHRRLLTKFVANKKKVFSVIQTQTHIEYIASIGGYILGGFLVNSGIYSIIYATVLSHIVSLIFILML